MVNPEGIWVQATITKLSYFFNIFINGVECRELGIDKEHVHFILDIGLKPLSDIVKKLKGHTARLLQEYP